MSGLWWCTDKYVIPGMKKELLAALLELLRGCTGKWDVVKDAINSKDAAVRLLALILALAPAVIATLACLSRGGRREDQRWALAGVATLFHPCKALASSSSVLGSPCPCSAFISARRAAAFTISTQKGRTLRR